MSPRTLLAADAAIKLGTIALLGFALLNQDLPQFQGKAFAGRAIVYPLALLVVPVGWWLLGRGRIAFPVASDILIGLPFLIDVAGNAANLYDAIEWWDEANHFVNWALATAGVGLILGHGSWSPLVRATLAFTYAVTSAVLWEFAEFVTFVPNSPEAATAYGDTLGDLALGMLGGLVGALVTARRPVNIEPGDSAGRAPGV